MNEERKQQFFNELAPNYDALTGNTTRAIFTRFLDTYGPTLNITTTSVIHDNASGPGTATQVLLQHSIGQDVAPQILATDFSPAMVTALETIRNDKVTTNKAWSNVTSNVLNSNDLSSIPDEHFTHSISNFSLFTIKDPVITLHETCRTLAANGTAVVLVWKRFAVEHLLAAAQDRVKGEGYAAEHALPVNGPQYTQKEVVPQQLVEAGFAEDKVQTWDIEHLVTEDMKEDWEGLLSFMTGSSISKGSTMGWSENEIHEWEGAVRWAMAEEVRNFGGLKFVGWVNVARK